MPKNTSTKLNLAPTAGYLIIEPAETETKTTSGLYIPETANQEKPQKGKVIAIGEDEVTNTGTKKSPVKVGDTVIYKKWGATEVKLEGKEYLFARFDDILAVVK